MGAIERTINAVADYTVGSGIVMLHLIMAGRDRQRADRIREEMRPWNRGARAASASMRVAWRADDAR